jgi:predicted ABC-type ATPase
MKKRNVYIIAGPNGAGKLVLEQIHNLANKGVDFAFETTLSGKTYVNFFKHLKMKGYHLHLFFLWIPNTELALGRIRERVSEGGHDVPAGDVRRRFNRSIYNLFNIYRPLLDSWMLFNNSGSKPIPIIKAKKNNLTIINKNLFEKIVKHSEAKL